MLLVHSLPHTQPQAPPPSRDSSGRSTDTAQLSVTSGFGTVLDQERDLRESIEAYLRIENSVYATSAHHVLRDQSAQIRGNIALLAQRYESLPHPERFRTCHERIASEGSTAPDPRLDPLRPLIVQHLNLLASIATLIGQRSDGQRGELILAEVARSHAEMAGALEALSFSDPASTQTHADCGTTGRSQTTELRVPNFPGRPLAQEEGDR